MIRSTVSTGRIRVLVLITIVLALAGAAPAARAQEFAFTTLAGKPGGSGLTNGPVSQAQFNQPAGVARDAQGNFFISDGDNNVIRKISIAGEVTTFAGTPGVGLLVDASGNQAGTRSPLGVAVDSTGNLYVTDRQGHAIRKITSAGVVTNFAGSATSAGSAEGSASTARFRNPAGLAVDGAGNIYVADRQNHTIRKITSAGVVTTFAGNPGSGGFADGLGNAARFASGSSWSSGRAFRRRRLLGSSVMSSANTIQTFSSRTSCLRRRGEML
jgi:hypothetical protein